MVTHHAKRLLGHADGLDHHLGFVRFKGKSRVREMSQVGVTNGALLVSVLAADLSKRWFKGRQLFRKANRSR
jgi:hypothetical protein